MAQIVFCKNVLSAFRNLQHIPGMFSQSVFITINAHEQPCVSPMFRPHALEEMSPASSVARSLTHLSGVGGPTGTPLPLLAHHGNIVLLPLNYLLPELPPVSEFTFRAPATFWCRGTPCA